MNILHKLLLLLSLSMTPAVTVSAAENTDFDTFQTAEQYLADFDYLTENSYRLSFAADYDYEGIYLFDYTNENYIFYCFPIYYDIDLTSVNYDGFKYYTNDKYQFLTFEYYNYEIPGGFSLHNYIGEEVYMPFLALDYVGMSQVINHDYTHGYYDDPTIYGSFYKFFTGFFPEYVVNEYHGIFTFIVVGFLLFLVFGFVFFLFRVIRRLVGFK